MNTAHLPEEKTWHDFDLGYAYFAFKRESARVYYMYLSAKGSRQHIQPGLSGVHYAMLIFA